MDVDGGDHDVSIHNKRVVWLLVHRGKQEKEVDVQVQQLEEVSVESYCIESVRRRRCRWDEVLAGC